MIPCVEKDFDTQYEKQFFKEAQAFRPESSYCLSKEDLGLLEIEAAKRDDSFQQQITFQVTECDPGNSYGVECASREEAVEFGDKGKFTVKVLHSQIDMKDRSNPAIKQKTEIVPFSDRIDFQRSWMQEFKFETHIIQRPDGDDEKFYKFVNAPVDHNMAWAEGYAMPLYAFTM